MKEEDYIAEMMPAVRRAAKLLVANEPKYGEGITLSTNDMYKCSTHAAQSTRRLHNPDGGTHAEAALVRAAKGVLKEIEGGDV